MRNVLKDILSKEGHILIGQKWQEALEKYDSEKPTSCLDIMPEVMASRIKKTGKAAKIVIFSQLVRENG